ncbi:MAG: CDP-alcohol phosphatidyltransferase family protein, partial [Bacteroidota bacterium]
MPNVLTLCNLMSGSLGILCVLNGNLTYAALCTWLGGCFDFLDGLLARRLDATSSFGKQLDALADLVTFGVLPYTILCLLMQQHAAFPYLRLATLVLPV